METSRPQNRAPLTTQELILRRIFAPRVVEPAQLPDIMWKHIYTGALGSTWGTLITGIFFVYLGTRIGMTLFQWGLMGAIVSWALCGEIFSALAVHRLRRRKLIWFFCALGDRTLRFLGILVALWFWRTGRAHAAVVLIIAISVASFLGSMGTAPWFSWLADIIPEEIHGRFWGRRTAWIASVVTAVTIPAAILMDRTQEQWKLELTVIVFLGATVLGLLDLIIHVTIPEPRMAPPPESNLLAEILLPVRDARFRPWLILNAAWAFAVGLGGTLSVVFCLQNLGLARHFVAGMVVLTVLPTLCGVVTAGWSGALIDRVGPKRVMFWSYLSWATLPAFWIFATPATAVYWIGGSSVVGGIGANTAASNAATKYITRFPPPEQRAMYIAVSDTAYYIVGGLGALVAGIIAKDLAGWKWAAGGWTFNALHLIFAISFILRLAVVALILPRIQDPSARRTP